MQLSQEMVIKVIGDMGLVEVVSNLEVDGALKNYGADSLDMMSILLSVQEITGVEVPDEDIDQLTSVKEICNYFNKETK
jgi:acyl carrier protein